MLSWFALSGVFSCTAIEKDHCIHAQVNLSEISHPDHDAGPPSIHHRAFFDFPGHPEIQVMPIPGTDSIRVDGQSMSLNLPSGEPFTIWSIAEYSDSEFIASGWTSSPRSGVLVKFTIEWDGPIS